MRVRYGVELRRGSQQDIGPGLTYSGLTPNDVAVSGDWYFGSFGLGFSGQREGFSLVDPLGTRITGGNLLRGYAGPSARVAIGPVRLEALAGYGMAQLPSFGNSASPQFAPALRHGPAFAAKLGLELPWDLRLELRGEYPLGLFATDAAGAPAAATGFSAGASLIWGLGNAGQLAYAAVADYQFVTDTLTVGQDVTAAQTLSRAGLALQFTFLDRTPPPPPPKFGNLRIRVVDADTGAPLPSPKLVLTSRGNPVRVRFEGGEFLAKDVDPGEVVAKSAAGGYLPGEGKATIVAGRDADLEVRAKKEPPKVGAISIVLVNKENAAPVANAVVKIRDQEYSAGPAGNLVVKDLPPGPIALSVTAAGFRPLQEVASVVAFKTSAVPLQMVELAKKVPATIRGTVRSTRGGRPIAATLDIPEAQVRTQASASGAFMIRISGGTYTVRISAPGFYPQRKSVSVKDGDQAIFNVDLHPSSR